MAHAIKYHTFPFPDHEGGEFQVSKGIKMKAGETDRGGMEGGSEEECFPWGTWIDEGSKETEEALLWVCERRVEGLMCLLRDRQASFRKRHPLMPPPPNRLPQSLRLFFFHSHCDA